MVDGRERVWRRTDEKFNQNLVTKCESFNGGSVMVRDGITMNSHTTSYVFTIKRVFDSRNLNRKYFTAARVTVYSIN